MLLFVTLAVLLLRAEPLWGFAAGAPRSTCRTMRPDHGRHITPQSTNHPYHIEVSAAYYKERQEIQVNLVQNGTGHNFVGVMLEARYVEASRLSPAVGKFRIRPQDVGTLKLACYDGAVSHKNNRRIEGFQVSWVAPYSGSGNIIFKATVVEDYNKIWLDIQSPVLTYGDAPEPEPETTPDDDVTTGGSCLPDQLDALPDVSVTPHIAILCRNSGQCPRDWRCCQSCIAGEGGQEDCAGYAICRRVKEESREEVVGELIGEPTRVVA